MFHFLINLFVSTVCTEGLLTLNAALRVACSLLAPLAASDPALLKPLKETLLALLQPNEDALGSVLPLNALAASLQVAVGRRLGVEEPQLMKIMRATLYTHNEWFKLQMCKDRFEGLLKINSLKEVNTPFLAPVSTSKSHADSCTNGSSQATVSSGTRMSEDGSSPTQVSSSDVICDEGAILKVMKARKLLYQNVRLCSPALQFWPSICYQVGDSFCIISTQVIKETVNEAMISFVQTQLLSILHEIVGSQARSGVLRTPSQSDAVGDDYEVHDYEINLD